MNKLNTLLMICAGTALLTISGISFADCPNTISATTASCVSNAKTQQFIQSFINYYVTTGDTADNMHSTQMPPQQVRQVDNLSNAHSSSIQTEYIAPIISNSPAKNKITTNNIHWF